MKTKTFFIVCCFLITNLCAQEITTIAATIIDEQTKESVEFVNIGFEDKGIGTVSNAKGNFSLTFNSDAIEDAQFLQISSIGYETRKIPLNQLSKLTSYRQSNRIETAFALYTQILYNSIPNVSAAEVQDQVINELQHLIANHKSKLDFKQLPDDLLKVGFKQDIRIVFDWNDAATEFELQFVSPQNKYFTFAHTAFDNRPLLAKEIEDGFTSKEFILDNAEPGKWLINFNYLGEQEEKNPTYLKYTLYRNYGLPTETKEIKVVNLSEYNKKITLDSFQL